MIICGVLVFHLAYCLQRLLVLISNRDVNAYMYIVELILTLRYFVHLGFRLNILSFATEMARLIHQTMAINVEWGKYIFEFFSSSMRRH
jgi:hypothetical protein